MTETNKKNLHIEDSYNVFSRKTMVKMIAEKCLETYGTSNAQQVLNRTFKSMCTEWYMHNIGYYLTKPFLFITEFYELNTRCKCVDLNER